MKIYLGTSLPPSIPQTSKLHSIDDYYEHIIDYDSFLSIFNITEAIY